MKNQNDFNLPQALDDDALEAVSGGIFTSSDRLPVDEWKLACCYYECKCCGLQSTNRSEHKSGCTVPGINPPSTGSLLWDNLYSTTNCCGSCKLCRTDASGEMYCGRT